MKNLSIFKDSVSAKTETKYVCYKKVFKLPHIAFGHSLLAVYRFD